MYVYELGKKAEMTDSFIVNKGRIVSLIWDWYIAIAHH